MINRLLHFLHRCFRIMLSPAQETEQIVLNRLRLDPQLGGIRSKHSVDWRSALARLGFTCRNPGGCVDVWISSNVDRIHPSPSYRKTDGRQRAVGYSCSSQRIWQRSLHRLNTSARRSRRCLCTRFGFHPFSPGFHSSVFFGPWRHYFYGISNR